MNPTHKMAGGKKGGSFKPQVAAERGKSNPGGLKPKGRGLEDHGDLRKRSGMNR